MATQDDDMGMQEIAQAVLNGRHAMGLTQRELADKAGTTDRTLGKIEAADFGGVAFATVARVLREVGLSLTTEQVHKPAREINAGMRQFFSDEYGMRGTRCR